MIEQDKQNLKIWQDKVEGYFPCEFKFINQSANSLNVEHLSLTDDQKFEFYKLMMEFVDGTAGAYRIEHKLLKKVANIFNTDLQVLTVDQRWNFYNLVYTFANRIRLKYDEEVSE